MPRHFVFLPIFRSPILIFSVKDRIAPELHALKTEQILLNLGTECRHCLSQFFVFLVSEITNLLVFRLYDMIWMHSPTVIVEEEKD